MSTDDTDIFANTDAQVTDISYQFAHISQRYSLRIDVDKNKVITSDGSQINVHLSGVQIEQVQVSKYLNLLVQEKKRVMHDLNSQKDRPDNNSICLAQTLPLEEDQYLHPD